MSQNNQQFTLALRVRFAETDKMAIAHHSSYVLWLEAGRIEWLRKQGMSYLQWEEAGVLLGVSHLNINYRKAAYFDDELNIEVKLSEARQRRISFSYDITRINDGALIATAETFHIPTNTNGKAISIPKGWIIELKKLLKFTGV